MKNLSILFFAMTLTIATVFFIPDAVFASFECTNFVLQEVPSPDKAWKANVTEHRCAGSLAFENVDSAAVTVTSIAHPSKTYLVFSIDEVTRTEMFSSNNLVNVASSLGTMELPSKVYRSNKEDAYFAGYAVENNDIPTIAWKDAKSLEISISHNRHIGMQRKSLPGLMINYLNKK